MKDFNYYAPTEVVFGNQHNNSQYQCRKAWYWLFSWNRDCSDMHYGKNEGDIAAKRTMAIMKMM